MGPIELIEKLINEHGSAQILRERLELVKAQTTEIERARSQAEATAKQLQAELHDTQAKLKEAQAQLQRLTGTLSAQACSHCGSGQTQRIGTRPSPTVFGKLGLREAVLRCEECQRTSHVELPLNG